MIDNNQLKQLARKYQTNEYTILREYVQILFLDRFYQNSKVATTYFKGGTAIRLLFNSPRFSEDLDFSSLLPRKQLEETVFSVARDLKDVLPNLSVKNLETIDGYSAKLYLTTPIASQPLTVKLDFSLRHDFRNVKTSAIVTDLPVKIISVVDYLAPEELLAEKIRATLHRQKGRDIFDLWFLLAKKISVDKQLVDEKLHIYKEKYNSKVLINKIEKWPDKEIGLDLRSFLAVNDRKIIPELKRLVREKL